MGLTLNHNEKVLLWALIIVMMLPEEAEEDVTATSEEDANAYLNAYLTY